MSVRKAVLSIGVGLAALWLIAPASAGATGWNWFDHDINEEPTTIVPKPVEPQGDLTITFAGQTFGPCEDVVIEGELYNAPMGVGEGELLKLLAGGEGCETSLAECEIETTTLEALPWNVKLLAEDEVEVTGIAIQFHLSEQCVTLGLPATPVIEGWVKGEFVAHETHGEVQTPTTFVFDGAWSNQNLIVKGSGGSAQLHGMLEFGTKLTAMFI